ncbi:NFX1-type zinc finger-containing protein 1 [Biomphalaria glabrata]|nr:NFX1-type zinc finger-containing protein 1 [Biomphalaria glabrata]
MEDEIDVFDEEVKEKNLRQKASAKSRCPTVKELKSMVENDEPCTILLRITRPDGSFEKLLKDYDTNSDKLLLTVRVLGKALSDPQGSQEQAIIDVITMFMNASDFQDKLCDSLRGSLSEEEDYVKSCLTILKVALEKQPNVAAKILESIFMRLDYAVDGFFPHLNNERDLVKRLLRKPMKFVDKKDAKRERENVPDEEMDPNDFRELSIFPTTTDFNPDVDISVRANKVQGRFRNVNDYLDIQFRLLRAELIIPLRENINKYLSRTDKHEQIGFNIYTDVRIVRPICQDKGLCLRLSFNIGRHRRVNWAISQRLKYGSLLCLSSDNFQNFQCAVVEDRDVKNLAKGLVDVRFVLNGIGFDPRNYDLTELMELTQGSRDRRFIMVESPSYFEAHKHVLMGLQNFTENNFPFWKYIGECQDIVDPPQYIRNLQQPKFDLRPILDPKFEIDENSPSVYKFSEDSSVAESVDILNRETWPNHNTLGVDTSQYLALHSAFSKEFSIIQGPPGTGKTFIGLLIIKCLLHNKQIWTEGDQKPILLVCYTNHALDQFLEGVLDFFEGKLVRVGTRSKSERLDKYNLRGLKHRARENRNVAQEIHLARQTQRNEMKAKKADIHLEAAQLELLEREIVKESFLKDLINPDTYENLTKKAGKESVIEKWLKITIDNDKLEKFSAEKLAKTSAVNETNPNETTDLAGSGADTDSDDSEDDSDIVEVITQASTTRQLDIDEDEDDDLNDLFFAEHLENFDDILTNMRKINQRLDDVDEEAARMREQNLAFSISDYGEEEMPRNLTKEQREHWNKLKPIKKRYQAILLHKLQQTERMTEDEAKQVFNPWNLNISDRWKLYRYWVDLKCRQIRGSIRDSTQQYERLARRYQEILHQEDKSILEKATIIGMTTTAAARYQGILREIGPKIILVEEAAEVFEGHVITSLTDQCQHVILIGDHKQLRPNPSVYKLKEKYGIDISLFERLVINDFPYDCLKYQHRMRPEISRLLKVPELYPELEDHEIVKHYPNIRGVNGNIRFIQHYQVDQREAETKTFSNYFEAQFLVGLSEYLIKQGYTSKQITILSPYAGQVHLIKTLCETLPRSQDVSKKMLKGLKISSVDNYQGEENDIILLSLVRSNEENDIGFLKTNNRICVALSRAKMGLYVIGNFHGISQSSPLMDTIINVAKTCEYIKESLSLSCPFHKLGETIIREFNDFKKVPEGGCNKPCGIRLECGHSCKRICHTDDIEHQDAVCTEPCQYRCETCHSFCHGDHQCGMHTNCKNLVEKIVPACGHKQMVPCYMSPNHFECIEVCKEKLRCGHACTGQCGKKHSHTEMKCQVLVQVTPDTCGHKQFQTECWKSSENTSSECTEPCQAVLECEHICTGTCGKCNNGRLHLNCQQKCQKILICGHSCNDTCNSCSPCSRQCETSCQHSRCPKKCGESCTPCVEWCSWACKHEKCPELCCQPCERPACDVPCPEQLHCGHNCAGLCGEKCPCLCSICDKDELIANSLNGYDGDPTTLFVEIDCGHVIEVDFMDQWMATSASDDSDQITIGLKSCPICKTPVRKCGRYNKQIKEMLCLIESVKRKYLGTNQKEKQRHLREIVSQLGGQEKNIIDRFLEPGVAIPSETILESQINQVNLFRRIYALRRVAIECKDRWPQRLLTLDNVLKDLERFSEWTLKSRTTFSSQNKTDAEDELERISILIDLHKIELNISVRELRDQIPSRHFDMLRQNIETLSQSVKASKDLISESRTLCEDLRKLVPDSHIALTNEEKLAIVKAVNVSLGAWYKCPNGHIYAIGECGRAMEEAHCPECRARIGGTNHELVANNQVAPEMDGAEGPIWNNLDADRELAERLQRQLNEGLQGYFF